jgi:transcriptional regulator with XRE-family HTH domain
MDTKSIIAEIRAHGLSQLEIERRTGIRQPTISRWENSGAPDSADGVLKLLALRNELTAAAKLGAGETATERQAA